MLTFDTMDQTKEEEDYGYHLFPERKKGKSSKEFIGESLFTYHYKCQFMLKVAVDTSEYFS